MVVVAVAVVAAAAAVVVLVVCVCVRASACACVRARGHRTMLLLLRASGTNRHTRDIRPLRVLGRGALLSLRTRDCHTEGRATKARLQKQKQIDSPRCQRPSPEYCLMAFYRETR